MIIWRENGVSARGWTRARVILGALLMSGLVACGGGEAGEAGGEPAAGSRFLSIGTGGTGGLYYVLGGAIASELTQQDPNHQYTAEVTGGSVENVNRVREGQLDLGIAMAITAVEAYSGGTDYPVPVEDLRVVAPFYANVTHVMVSRSSQAQSLADLRGQRVSVGAAGSGTEQEARMLLEAAGITYEDISPQYLSFAESGAAIQDEAIDAAIISTGYPAGAILEATTTGGARLIPVGADILQVLQERYSFYEAGEIPAGVYPGVTTPVPTVQTRNWVVAREDLPADVVEHLLSVMVDRKDALIGVHEMARQIDISDLEAAPIPLHPATQAWLTTRAP